MLEELRNDLKLVENKFTETAKLTAISVKYGLKSAGRQKMTGELTALIVDKIRAVRKAMEQK